MEAELQERRAEVEKLIARGRKAEADARIKLDKEVDALQEHLDAVENKFSQLKESGEESWDEVKSGFSGAWEALGESMRRAKSKFKAD